MDVDQILFTHECRERGRNMREAAATQIERQLQKDPTNLADRLALVSYLTTKHFSGENVDEIRKRRAEHVFWLIQNFPEHPAVGDAECIILRQIDDAHYDQFRQLWCAQVEKYPDNVMVVGNAGSALFEDSELAEKFLIKATQLAPEEQRWHLFLSVTYEIRAKYSKESERDHWNKLSAESMERCKAARKAKKDRINEQILEAELKQLSDD